VCSFGSRCNEKRWEIDWRRDYGMQVSAFTVWVSVREWRCAKLRGMAKLCVFRSLGRELVALGDLPGCDEDGGVDGILCDVNVAM
jgi:hypothetical protein